jgi:hypothetical protein
MGIIGDKFECTIGQNNIKDRNGGFSATATGAFAFSSAK